MIIEIRSAQVVDAKRLAEVFNLSFYSDYVKYGECLGYNRTEESMLSSMKKYHVYKILVDGQIVGAISVKKESEGHFFLGALCIIPEYANQGIGQKAMKFLDIEFPGARHWSLETPTDKLQNHHFYRKFGFRMTKKYMDGSVPTSYFQRTIYDLK